MLNRRILRAKALQGLYAFYKCQEANFNIALSYIEDTYLPNLNSMEIPDRSELITKKVYSLKVFNQHFKNDSFDKLNDTVREEEQVALEAFRDYTAQNERDFQHFLDMTLKNAEKIYDYYLSLLALLIEFTDLENITLNDTKYTSQKLLSGNSIVELFRKDENFNKLLREHKISWQNDKETVYNWYKTLLKKEKNFHDHNKDQRDPALNTDKKNCILIFKDILFKNDMFNSFMESTDINWSEDKHVLKSMVIKTLKNLELSDHKVNLSVLSQNWEEDKTFFRKLFEVTIRNDKEYEKLIAEKSKNWDIDRIAIIDKIILKMAIGEMIHFSSIPVKVSINEYIELSKNFSTPKSKKFVNGILDVLSEELKVQGVIKKSGRGLIDNK